MKKIALAINAFLLLFATTTTISCCPNDENVQNEETADSTAIKQKESEGFPSQLNIRYVDMDSVAQNYNLAKDFNEMYIRAVSNLDQQQRAKASEIQNFGASIDQKMRSNGYLSEASYNADVEKFNKMQTDANNYLAGLQRRAEQELAQQQLEIQDSIQSFVIDYNKTHKYDAIINKAAGIYFNPELDITKEIVEGLNARYNKVSAPSKTDSGKTTPATE